MKTMAVLIVSALVTSILLITSFVSPAQARYPVGTSSEPYYGLGIRDHNDTLDKQGIFGRGYIYHQNTGGRFFQEFCTTQKREWDWGWRATWWITVGHWKGSGTAAPRHIVRWAKGGTPTHSSHDYPPLETYRDYTILGLGDTWYVFIEGGQVEVVTMPGYTRCFLAGYTSKSAVSGEAWSWYEDLRWFTPGIGWEPWNQLLVYHTTAMRAYKITNTWFYTMHG